MPILLAFYNKGDIKMEITDDDVYNSMKSFYEYGSNGVDMLIADTPADFARQIGRCMADRDFCRSVGAAARGLIARCYDGQRLTNELMDFYNKRLEK